MGKTQPYHQHDCDNCIYLGSDIEGDVKTDYYFCHRKESHPCLSTLIARYGEYGDYSSGFEFTMSSIGLNKALKLAVEKNILPDDIKEHIKHRQNEWFEYCQHDKRYAEGVAKIWEGRERFIIK
jgi:hypothetical protein